MLLHSPCLKTTINSPMVFELLGLSSAHSLFKITSVCLLIAVKNTYKWRIRTGRLTQPIYMLSFWMQSMKF